MIKKDSFFTGLVAGLCLPIITYAIIMIIIEQLGHFESTSMISIRPNTHALLSIASNIILIQIAKNRYWDNSIRGIVFTTIILCGVWFYKFSFMFNI